MLMTAGFSLSEISNLTMPQVQAYCEAINDYKSQEFKTDVLSQMYGSRGGPEDLEKILHKE